MSNVLEDYTFGESKSEITLAKMLTQIDDPHLTSYVSRLLGNLSNHMKNLVIKDETLGTRIYLYRALRDSYDKTIHEALSVQRHPEIESYFQNAIVIRLRKLLMLKQKTK